VDEEKWNWAHSDPGNESSKGGSVTESVLAEVFAEHIGLRWESIGFERMPGSGLREVSREFDEVSEGGVNHGL
jgi:hypothetical protein